jgi:hypothetical protein
MTDPNATAELDDRWEPWEQTGLPDDIAHRAVAAGCLDPRAEPHAAEQLRCLAELLERHQPATAVTTYLAQPDRHDHRLERWAALRLAERLTLAPGVPALDWPGWEHPDRHQRRRVLHPIEVAVVRLYAIRTAQRAAIIGLLETPASSGELVALNPLAFTVDAGAPTAVALPGTGRATTAGPEPRSPRVRPLPDWAKPHLAKRLTAAGGDHNVLYDGRSPDPDMVQSAVLMNVRKVLHDAGLAADPTVAPASIANTAARALYDSTGNLEEVAAAVGTDSLDRLRREIGLRPHGSARHPTCSPPSPARVG